MQANQSGWYCRVTPSLWIGDIARPGRWRRFWQWLLLGWTWHRAEHLYTLCVRSPGQPCRDALVCEGLTLTPAEHLAKEHAR